LGRRKSKLFSLPLSAQQTTHAQGKSFLFGESQPAAKHGLLSLDEKAVNYF
jgi:hypothetical protein